jgi:exonuclease III
MTVADLYSGIEHRPSENKAMRIVSWNIERPRIDKGLDKNFFIIELIKEINLDILFLTETNSVINFSSDYFKLQTIPLPEDYEHCTYHDGENRVTIFSKYKFIDIKIDTYDPYTSVCGEVVTPFGNLILYGSIIGSFGPVGPENMEYFKRDLIGQQKDIRKLREKGKLCYSGDFNMLFSSDWYQDGYPKEEVRKMSCFFEEMHLVNETKQNKDCAIHIVINDDFVKEKKLEVKHHRIPIKGIIFKNMKGRISDHDLVMIDIGTTEMFGAKAVVYD